jgi:MFS family permease
LLGPYSTILRHPGAARFAATGVLARFDLAMHSLGVILLVVRLGGSYTLATVLTGTNALASAVCAPLLSRQTDRRGQHLMLLGQALVYLPAVLGLIWSVWAGAPVELMVLFSLLAGASNPLVSSMVRARWSAIYRGSPSLRTAFAMESMIDAAVIAVGAPLATFLAVQLFAAAPLLLAAVAGAGAAVALALQRRTEPPVAPRRAGRERGASLVPPGVPAVLAVLVFVGGYLGSFDVATIAVALESGRTQLGGWILGTYALGSTIGGALIGRAPSVSVRRQLYLVLVLLSAAVWPMLFAHSPAPLLVLGFTAGLGVAPTIILTIGLAEARATPQRLTEALAWTGSALVTGTAAGQLLAGHMVDWLGGNAGYTVTLACGLGALLAALSGLRPGSDELS